MTSHTSECPHCGAKIGSGSPKYCEYCGTILPREDPREPAKSDHFDALLGHPDLQRLLALKPSSVGLIASGGCSIAFAVFFVGVASMIALKFFSGSRMMPAYGPAGFNLLFTIVPVVIVLGGVFLVIKTIGGTARIASSPMRRTPSRVVGKRTKMRGDGRHSHARTGYFVTLEHADGRREELHATGPVSGRLATDDMGVAYVKGGHLIAFERVST